VLYGVKLRRYIYFFSLLETIIVDYSSLDDEALIGLLLQANTEALGVLYDRYSRLVFSLALHTVGDPATAEEITQDVFFRIWEKASTYRPEQAKVSTWLTSITRYRSIDILRQRGVRPEQNSTRLAVYDQHPCTIPGFCRVLGN
jgi:DNA-directed RNA polymerase specialized sigma24 family protein